MLRQNPVAGGVGVHRSQRAERHHRSLHSELIAIIEAAVQDEPALSPAAILGELRRMGLSMPSEVTSIIRADRDDR